MLKYEIYKCTCEVKARHIDTFNAGDTFTEDIEPELIETFTDETEAQAEFESDFYKPDKVYYSGNAFPYYLITEYFLVTSEYDENDEFIQQIGADVWQEKEI